MVKDVKLTNGILRAIINDPASSQTEVAMARELSSIRTLLYDIADTEGFITNENTLSCCLYDYEEHEISFAHQYIRKLRDLIKD